MASKQLVRLPNQLIEDCWGFAQRAVDDYQAGLNPNSLACSYRNADKDVELWAIAKMSECAFAIYAGADPKYALHWERRPDNGYDLFWLGKRWDVKNTKMHCQYLIWSKAKNHIYDSKLFDAMALVKARWPDFLICGWIGKSDFLNKKKVAAAGHALDAGTWFVHESELHHQFEIEAAA